VLPRPALEAQPEEIPLELLHEDDDFVVVNKPAGMVVHAGAGVAHGTLVNALLHRLGVLSNEGGAVRPGIVHRLDRGTSGALVVARNDSAHRALADQFRARTVHKTYLALLHGRLARDTGTIALPVARDPRRRTRMTAGLLRGRESRTDWRVLLRPGNFTLVAAEPKTGRTHQIRVHFAATGHPLVGDTLYGAPERARAARVLLPELGRVFLHAARLQFAHPRTGVPVDVRAPLDRSLRTYLTLLANAVEIEPRSIDAALRGYL
jgi:23S rRNA pseudouridine1911/1915/1917 synthase